MPKHHFFSRAHSKKQNTYLKKQALQEIERKQAWSKEQQILLTAEYPAPEHIVKKLLDAYYCWQALNATVEIASSSQVIAETTEWRSSSARCTPKKLLTFCMLTALALGCVTGVAAVQVEMQPPQPPKTSADELSNHEFRHPTQMDPSAFASAINPPVARKLPKECAEYKIVHGNPYTAPRVLLGEVHTPQCTDKRAQCVEALLRQAESDSAKKPITAKQTILLHEEAPFAQQTLCKQFGFKNIDTCRGWNKPEPAYSNFSALLGNSQATSDIHTGLKLIFEEILSATKSPAEQRKMATEMLAEKIIMTEQGILEVKKEEEKLYQQFKKTHPIVSRKDFFSMKADTLYLFQYSLPLLTDLITKLDQGLSLKKALSYVEEKKNQANQVLYHVRREVNSTLRQPNRYLLQSVAQATKEAERVFVFAGDVHVNDQSNRSLPGEQEIVREELYAGLEELGEFAVLSCCPPRK